MGIPKEVIARLVRRDFSEAAVIVVRLPFE